MVQRFGFVAVTILAILVLMMARGISLAPVYVSATPTVPFTCTFFSNLVQSTITQGTPSVIVTGFDDCVPQNSSFDMIVDQGVCGGTELSRTIGTSVAFSYTFHVPTSSLAPGTYCVRTDDHVSPLIDNILTVTGSAPPIPEYPIGLSILAIFMILAYAVIKRKTRN